MAVEGRNPFTASFGAPSGVTYVGRDAELAEFLQGLDDLPGSTFRAIMISGARGVGKTTLQTVMVDRARESGWITASVTAGPGIAERILDKAALAAEDLLEPEPRRLLTGVSIAGFSLTATGVPAETPSWWRRMVRLLDALEANGSGLVISIDEVHREEAELRPLFQQYQELVNEGRNLAIVMAGLPGAVEGILAEYALTFVQRARRHVLGPIPLADIEQAYLTAFAESGKQMPATLAAQAAERTEGYPYLFQLIGYFTWRATEGRSLVTEDDLSAALVPAQELAGQNLFEIELRSVSNREREFLTAMLVDEADSAVTDVAARMGVSANNANYVRSRLIARSLIEPAGRGRVRFSSRYLRSYLADSP